MSAPCSLIFTENALRPFVSSGSILYCSYCGIQGILNLSNVETFYQLIIFRATVNLANLKKILPISLRTLFWNIFSLFFMSLSNSVIFASSALISSVNEFRAPVNRDIPCFISFKSSIHSLLGTFERPIKANYKAILYMPFKSFCYNLCNSIKLLLIMLIFINVYLGV